MHTKIKEILDEYDQVGTKGFNELDLYNKLQSVLIPPEEVTPGTMGEQMAFGFWEDYDHSHTQWGTYFGPFTVIPNEDGSYREAPSIRLVTPEILSYWINRTKSAENPVLIARYSSLVWDFSPLIVQKNALIDIGRAFISSSIEIANEQYLPEPLTAFRKLERALSIALSISDKVLIRSVSQAIINLESLVAQDLLPGLWGYSFDLLVSNRKVELPVSDETQIVNELENKLNRLTTGGLASQHVWPARHAATRLGDYYRKNSKKDEVRRVILAYGLFAEQVGLVGLVHDAAATYEDLFKIYTSYHLKQEAELMLLKIRESSSKTPAEMKTIRAEFDFPKELLNQYLEEMTANSLEDSMYRLIITNIPIREETADNLRKKSSKAPISYLFTQQIIDSKGRVIATLPPLAQDFDGHLARETGIQFSINAPLIKLFIGELINKYGFNTTDIIKLMKNCPVLDKNRLPVIEKGIDAYFANDFIVAIHLIIPQIEEIIRNVLEAGGGNVLKKAQGGGFHLRTFDDILRDKIVEDSLGLNMVNYFRILFTDPKGWNLRNNICHGMSPFEDFDFKHADRVIHALMCLTLIEYQNSE